MRLGVKLSNGDFAESLYDCDPEFGFRVVESEFRTKTSQEDVSGGKIKRGKSGSELLEDLYDSYSERIKNIAKEFLSKESKGEEDSDRLIDESLSVTQMHGFLYPALKGESESLLMPMHQYVSIERPVTRCIHVPGLRDNPSRTYETTAVGTRFPGAFNDYVASVIHSWQREDDERLERLVGQLQHMRLTGGIESDRVNDTQVELRVEQQPVGSKSERMINVADVGIGVSQVLPVLVACLVADSGQLVYIEQPEIHLHPKAQTRLADALVAAAKRGVRVVVETHSQLLLLALQTRIAEDEIDPEQVMLHWFERREDGVTEVNSKAPDDKGAFGDWPEDFSEVEMEAENRYLDAAEKHLFEE
jgi:hypothetical protein